MLYSPIKSDNRISGITYTLKSYLCTLYEFSLEESKDVGQNWDRLTACINKRQRVHSSALDISTVKKRLGLPQCVRVHFGPFDATPIPMGH